MMYNQKGDENEEGGLEIAEQLQFLYDGKSLVKKETIQAGKLVRIGQWDWRVLDVQSDRALLISDLVINTLPYVQPYGKPPFYGITEF